MKDFKKNRTILIVMFTICLMVISITFLFKQTDNYLRIENVVILAVMAITALTVLIMLYLQSGNKKDYQERDKAYYLQKELLYMLEKYSMRDKEANNVLISEVKKIIESLQKQEVELTTTEKEKLLKIIEEKVETSVVEKIIETFQNKYSEIAFKDSKYKEIADDIYEMKARLNVEISKLTLRANLNLAIGSATTIFAIFVLWFTVVNKMPEFSNIENIVSTLIPRISLVIFIEIFAFFFLKMYKSNLSDIKYYHNETTNCEFKILALKTTFVKNAETEIPKIIDRFTAVERNFILKKGESTVEIEKDKLDKNTNNKLINLIKELIGTKNK